MTSTIYLRGLGSRIDQPVVGFYLDGFPILDKNAYDAEIPDLRQAVLLRGPQSTLFGRNTTGGILSLQTLSPAHFQGGSALLEYGSAGSWTAGASLYRGAHGGVVRYRHTNGFFTNRFDGRRVDPSDALLLRYRALVHQRGKWSAENLLQVNAISQGAFPYARFKDGDLLDINYNDPGTYRRIFVLEGIKATYEGDRILMESYTGLQALADRMQMDNDYTPEAIFSLEQRQLEGALSQEVLLRPAVDTGNWKPLTGLFAFYRFNRMAAPVTFLPDGIRTLILDNANPHIPEDFGQLAFEEDSFVLESLFGLHTWNIALFHESTYRHGRWAFTAGIRLDYEADAMHYDARTEVHYRLVPLMSRAKTFNTPYAGTRGQHHFQILPKIAVRLDAGAGWDLFVLAAKGFKAGGFNTQIFSDILRNEMMLGITGGLGIHLPGEAHTDASVTSYKPEKAWNLETGFRWAHKAWKAAGSVFYIACTDQQVTVFPPGKTTGRMMRNAGRSRSIGAEAELSWHPGNFRADASLGYTDARFIAYDDGLEDYSGKHVPYAPAGTLALHVGYTLGKVTASALMKGTGPIWWDEANTLRQDFYLTLGARISARFEGWSLWVRGENLTAQDIPVFYFKSMGNEFFQRMKPLRGAIGIQVLIP